MTEPMDTEAALELAQRRIAALEATVTAQQQEIASHTRRNQALTDLLAFVHELSSVRDEGSLMTITCRAARRLSEADGAALVLYDDEDTCSIANADGVGPSYEGRIPVDSCFEGRVMLTGKAIACNDAQASPGDLGPTGLTSACGLLVVPVQHEEEPIGALGSYWAAPHAANADEEEFLQALADIVAVMLDNIQTLTDLERRVRRRTALLHRAKDAAEAANRAKSAFLTNMSHELRTPLNAILGYTQILRRDLELTARQREGINIIHRSGEHLLTLINDILDLAKIEADRMELNEGIVYIRSVLDEMVELFRLRAEHKGLSFNYHPGDALPVAIYADETRLRQILLNLLSNAVKFTQHGGVSFRIARQEETWSLEVEDTGPGIEPRDLQALFEPFYQAGDRRLREEGTGLGLAISRKLVALMGGELIVKSHLGEGSLFRLTLPLQVVEESPNEPMQTDVDTILGIEGTPPTLLIVDDKPENRAVLTSLLIPFGFTVREAPDGQEALEAIVAAPDLVITDLIMPRMDGFELLRQLRNHPTLVNLPVIASSASVFEQDKQRSFEAGCTAFVPKPIHAEELLTALQRALGLTWITAPAKDEPQDLTWEEALPDSWRKRFLELSRRGDLAQIARSAEELAAAEPDLAPLAREMRRLALAFQVKDLCALIDRCATRDSQQRP